MEIVIIGTGNVASVLGRLAVKAGHRVKAVWGRNSTDSRRLALELGAYSVPQLAAVPAGADIYIMAVSDPAIPALVAEWPLPEALLVHTAGSVSRHVLDAASKQTGVLYPYQSIRKGSDLEGRNCPWLIDGSSPANLELLRKFASSLGGKVRQATDEQRRYFHLAAVFSNNFSNHLYTLAEAFCQEKGIDFDMLQPLLSQLPARMLLQSPAALQTGPAIRNDQATMALHLELLRDHPEMQAFYELFSTSIRNYYRN